MLPPGHFKPSYIRHTQHGSLLNVKLRYANPAAATRHNKKLSYRKQIARQLRTQYVDGI